MSHYNYDNIDHTQKYSGFPNKQSPEERGFWRKFLDLVFPFLSRKHRQAERMLESKIRVEEETARNLMADTELKKAQAAKERIEAMKMAKAITEDAARMEQTALDKQPIELLSKEEVKEELFAFMEKARIMRLKYGLEINLSIESLKAVEALSGGWKSTGKVEKIAFDIILLGVGSQKLKTVKAVKTIMGIGLVEAKEIVESVPSKIMTGISKEEGERVKEALEEAGAEVVLE